MSERIAYYKGVKYWLAITHRRLTGIRPPFDIVTRWVTLSMAGLLTILEGFAWDGPSGPAPDLPCLMRGSLEHDAFALLMRRGFLDFDTFFGPINRELEAICKEDQCPELAASLVFQSVNDLSDGRWARYCSEGDGGDRPLCFAP